MATPLPYGRGSFRSLSWHFAPASSLLGTALLLASIPPLSDSQTTRVQTADDDSTTVDEAAFYALLENAKAWTGGKAGAVVPDYAALRENPAKWRGELCLVQGELETVLEVSDLSRDSYASVKGLVLRPESGRPVIVYLLRPPDLTYRSRQPPLVAERGAAVEVVARFYKRLKDESRGGKERTYLTFVGKEVTTLRTPEGSSPAGTWAIPAAVIVLLGVWFVLLSRSRRRKTEQALYHPRRESEGEAADPQIAADPAEALRRLSEQPEEPPDDHRRD